MSIPATAPNALPISQVDGYPIEQAVHHGKSTLPDLLGCRVYGVRRSSDHAWAWVWLHTDNTEALVSPWACHGGHLPATARRQRVRSDRTHFGACPYCGQDALALVATVENRMVLPPHNAA